MTNRIEQLIDKDDSDMQPCPLERYVEFVIVDYVWRTERRLPISTSTLKLLATMNVAGISPSDAAQMLRSKKGQMHLR
jgi:hypothetical protein